MRATLETRPSWVSKRGRGEEMNQLSVDGFLFVMFWGCALMVVASIVLAVWERGDRNG